MPPRFGSEKVLCAHCNERVYPLEAVKLDALTFHKRCMKCSHCNGQLTLGKLAQIDGKLFCKPHFVELFRRRGTYHEFDENADENAPAFGSSKSFSGSKQNSSRGSSQDFEQDEISAISDGSVEEPVQVEKKKKQHRRTESKYASRTTEILKAMRMRNVDKVKAAVEENGISCLFEPDEDGITPIEFAFTTNNNQVGRAMLKMLEQEFEKLSSAQLENRSSQMTFKVEQAGGQTVDPAAEETTDADKQVGDEEETEIVKESDDIQV